MTEQEIINKTAEHVREVLSGEASGHDWWHCYRVWKNTIHIGTIEGVNLTVVQLAALLHDIYDWKLHNGDISLGPAHSKEWLESLGTEPKIVTAVYKIIEALGYKGKTKTEGLSREGQVVQDADRLEAIGAIGIARTFAFGGFKNREIYNPEISPIENPSKEDLLKGSHTINHFYEKLLLVKDFMHTETAKKMAAHRHKVLEDFLQEFLNEWEGKV